MRYLSVLLFVLLAAAGPATPVPGPVRVIGGPGGGCIAGAVPLPDAAPGLQTIRRSYSTFWGHPDTIAALLELGRRAHAAGMPDLYMGDISAPRGGPIPGGHISHQMGLDADVYLDLSPRQPLTDAQRDSLEPPSMVQSGGRSIDLRYWSEAQVTLLKMAVSLPGVDRVLVNPAIKRQLCNQVAGDRSWLRFVRPWWGHSSHMHIHFKCPPGQPLCPAGPPPPPAGDGCDTSLQWWFDQLDQPAPAKPSAPPPPAKLPEACRAIMAAPG